MKLSNGIKIESIYVHIYKAIQIILQQVLALSLP